MEKVDIVWSTIESNKKQSHPAKNRPYESLIGSKHICRCPQVDEIQGVTVCEHKIACIGKQDSYNFVNVKRGRDVDIHMQKLGTSRVWAIGDKL